MNRRTIAVSIAALGLAALAACIAPGVTPTAAQTPAAQPSGQVAATPTGPMVRSGATIKLSEHVFAIPDNSVGGVPNVGFVVGRTGTLVIETGMGPLNGQTILAEALKVSGKTKLYLVTTHVHPEHDLGAQAFPATTTFIRSNAQVQEIADQGMTTADAFRARSDVNKRLLEGAAFRKADVTFDKSYDLDLGGVKVKLIAVGPSHTAGDTAMFVEGDRVLFAGDLAMKAMPAFASPKSSLKQWLTSLDAYDALKPAIVVPSHGPIGDATYIAGYRTYMTRIRDRTAALKREGKTLEQATETVTAELKADNVETGRASGAIKAAYAEAP